MNRKMSIADKRGRDNPIHECRTPGRATTSAAMTPTLTRGTPTTGSTATALDAPERCPVQETTACAESGSLTTPWSQVGGRVIRGQSDRRNHPLIHSPPFSTSLCLSFHQVKTHLLGKINSWLASRAWEEGQIVRSCERRTMTN